MHTLVEAGAQVVVCSTLPKGLPDISRNGALQTIFIPAGWKGSPTMRLEPRFSRDRLPAELCKKGNQCRNGSTNLVPIHHTLMDDL